MTTKSVCVMLCVVLATVDSHVREAHTENWVGGTSHISIHSLMWNEPNPQGLWGLCQVTVKRCVDASVYFRQHYLNKQQDDVQ